jgi:putative tryptophan/tyrosine transport system substrate-binding protein
MNPDLIFTVGGTGLMALVSETRSIPILFASFGDPVASGLVASLAHPSGNATGFTAYQGSFGTRWLQLLKEMAPAVTHLLVLSPGNPNSAATLPEIERAVGSFALQMTTARVAGPDDIERAIGAAARVPNLGMIVLPGSLTIVHRDLIIAIATGYRVPAIYGSRISQRPVASSPTRPTCSNSSGKPSPMVIAFFGARSPASFQCKRQASSS